MQAVKRLLAPLFGTPPGAAHRAAPTHPPPDGAQAMLAYLCKAYTEIERETYTYAMDDIHVVHHIPWHRICTKA